MELKDKIAQLLLLGFEGHHPSDDSSIAKELSEHPIGGVVLFNYHCKKKTLEKNIESPEQVTKLIEHLKKTAKKCSDAPLFIAIDYEGGNVNRLHETQGFPQTKSAKTVGAMEPQQITDEAVNMAKTLKTHGFNFNFAPVVDLHSNPNNKVIAGLERAFCHNPHRVDEIAQQFRSALRAENILSAYKHFPGHGSSVEDSHKGVVDITDSWHPSELLPYERLTQSPHQLDSVMVGHLTHQKLDSRGLPATLSDEMIQGLLRQKMGYDGLVVSDDMQMDAISAHFSLRESLVLALNAGIDLLIFGNQLVNEPVRASEIIALVENAVNNGDISHQRIDDAFNRIQRAKRLL